MKKEENPLYVPKHQALRSGYYRFEPSWFSYDIRPEHISPLMFTILSILPWYKANPYNGYLIKMNKWTNSSHFSDFIYNPHEKTDFYLKKTLGFE